MLCARCKRGCAARRILHEGAELGLLAAEPAPLARDLLPLSNRLPAFPDAPHRSASHRPHHVVASALLDPERPPRERRCLRGISGGGTLRDPQPGIASTQNRACG